MIENSGLVLGTDYWILKEGSYAGQSGGNAAITLKYRVKYESWKTLFDYIRGFAYWDGADLKREIAEEHPTIPGWRCNGQITYDQTGKFVGDDEPAPEFMLLQVQFAPLAYAFLNDDEIGYEWERYTSRDVEYAPDLISGGAGFFKFCQSGTPLATAPTKNETIQILSYTWHMVPVWDGSYTGFDANISTAINDANLRLPNHKNIQLALNKINHNVFDIYGYEPHTLLFLGVEKKLLDPSLSEDLFTFYWDITFKFAYRNAGTPVFCYPVQYAMGWDWTYDWLHDTYDLYTINGNPYSPSQYSDFDINKLWERDDPTVEEVDPCASS